MIVIVPGEISASRATFISSIVNAEEKVINNFCKNNYFVS